MDSFKIPFLWILTMTAMFMINSCLGKTIARDIYFISPRKKTVFVAPPVNYTDQYLLDTQIREELKKYFHAQTRFGVVEFTENSDLYILLYINGFTSKEISDYGFGNHLVNIQASLFVSDASFHQKNFQNQDQIGRYYYKNYPLNIEVVDYVSEENNFYSQERIMGLAVNKLNTSIYNLMLTRRLPSN